MRIAFDGKKAAGNRAGLGNYSRFVIECMAKSYPQHEFDVYVGKDNGNPLLDSIRRYPNVNICTPTHPVLKHFPALWERLGIPYELKKRGADIWHGLANVLPHNISKAKDVRSVVTIHDLIFLSFPHTYSWADRHFYNIKFRRACRKADCIMAVSKCTADDISKYYNIPRRSIRVVYQGCNPIFRRQCTEESKKTVRHKYGLPERYVLSVGTIEERKNTELIVRALKNFEDLDFVLVGRRTKYAETVERLADELGVSDRLHILSGVGTDELPAIYQSAEIFIYPSKYEGFGIPMLEALCSGVPAIGAIGSCLEEAGGDAALYTDPEDAEDLTSKIREILGNPTLRKEMITKGLAYADKFTDGILARDMMAVYEDVT